jgi:hypothetical protein
MSDPASDLPEIVTTQKEAALRLKVTTRTIRDWKKLPGFPDTHQGYDIPAIEQWVEEQTRKGSEDSDKARDLNIRIKEQQLRAETAKADKLERQEEFDRGNILPRDLWESFAAECIGKARDHLRQIPQQLCKLVPRKYWPKLRGEGDLTVRKILTELARELERGPDD